MFNIQLTAGILIVIYFVITTFLYIKERNNYLIYYRKNSVTYICSLCGLLFCLVLPINIEFEGPCLVDVWMITLTTFGAILCSLYRGIRMLLLKKKNMFSLKYGKQDSTKVRDQLVELSSFSRNDYGLETNIVDPNNYIKQLNRIIDKGMLRWFFIVPYITISIVTLVVFIVIYAGDHIYIFEKCINITDVLFYPITFFGAFILIILPFAYMHLIRLKFKSRWNLKTEMMVNSSLLGAGLIVYSITNYSTSNYVGVTLLMAIFAFIQFNTVVVPLLEIKKEKERKKQKDYKSIDEFIVSLENKSFLELLKEKAMENFCIENVLLWEAYYDLMLNIKEYYKTGKKYNTSNVVNSSFYESGAQLQVEDKSENIDFENNNQSIKYSIGNTENVTKDSILESELINSNFDTIDDKNSINAVSNPLKEGTPTLPSTSYPIRQGNNYLNSGEKLSFNDNINIDNHLLSTSENNKTILKNESQTNVVQTPINQHIPHERNKSSCSERNHNKSGSINININEINNVDITDLRKKSENEINNSIHTGDIGPQNELTTVVNSNNPISPLNQNSSPLSRKTSKNSNDHTNISRVTSIQSTIKNNNNNNNNNNTALYVTSQNTLESHSITTDNKSHIIDIQKTEKTSCLSKYSTKDKESDVQHQTTKKKSTSTNNNSKSLLKYIKSLTLSNYEFDPKFKPLFDQIYYLYIYKDGIAPVILSLNTLNAISNKIDNEEYSYDMYQSAIEEVINILYMNIYPKIE
ncbi:hypothetical protein BCR32DRAFT_291604 [Anaeromyces robustus]|uniref:RGS domain-containing protein n=1 Tax=Anaeromyces robustus TaxID=1754192 RepID=A0A1Y1XE54_9FUNG|nr:hypothetical protein BCR32DRAFT_291604 [Anaeromyces robustus]|eukprot:ORX84019.1 hypothetical protein BCR32DRAFT_291604 [Anaeromyces robustus]